jgi:hypothetical protein
MILPSLAPNQQMAGGPLALAMWAGPVAGWSSPVARQAHNLKVAGSNPAPATKFSQVGQIGQVGKFRLDCFCGQTRWAPPGSGSHESRLAGVLFEGAFAL